MGVTNTENFTKDQNDIAIMFKAMGHPARIAIIEHLMQVNACICGDLVNVLPLAQPTVSQHLKELKNAGLIKGSVEGNTICYCINGEAVDTLIKYFGKVSSKIKSLNNNCC